MFLLVNACSVMLFSGPQRRCVWGSPYLDAHGEEDQYLRRGKALMLDAGRLEQLRAMMALHNMPKDSRALHSFSRRHGQSY